MQLTPMRPLRMLTPGIALMVAASHAASAQSAPRWALVSAPVASIGLVEGSADQELANVSGARRLSDGRVLVANGKPLELRVYNAAGKLLQRIGRSGDGPGEYRGRLDLLPAGGDSILVYDQESLRTLLYSPAGRLLHEWPASQGGSDRGMVLFRRTIAPATPAQLNHCMRQVVSTLPLLAPPALRTILPDGAGHFWVQVDRGNIWTVYATGGQAVGVVTLPPHFELYRVDHGYLTGRTLTDDDVEEVQVLRLATPTTAAVGACGNVTDSFAQVRGDRVAPLIKGLRNSMTAGELAYSNYGSYVMTIDSMPSLKSQLPSATSFRVLTATRRGWAAMLFDNRSTLVCIFGVGAGTLPGWPDGAIRCSD